jgi:hypothetical protein
VDRYFSMGVGSLVVGAAAGDVSDRKSTVEADASRYGETGSKAARNIHGQPEMDTK